MDQGQARGEARGVLPERIGIGLSLVLFAIPALGLWLATRHLLPELVASGREPLAAWFLAGSLVFAPLLVLALTGAFADRSPARPGVLQVLRVRSLTRREWRIVGAALVVTFAVMAGLSLINATLWPRLPPHPPFMAVEPITTGKLYLLALWLPFFALNIIGEELWWRGMIQPRQELVFGAWTWIVQGVLHGLFHFSFGLGVMFILLPVLFSIPWAVQRTGNTTVGIIIHAVVNGAGFLAVVLGLLPVQMRG